MVICSGKVEETGICIRAYCVVRQQQENGPAPAGSSLTQECSLCEDPREKIKHFAIAVGILFG